ncbi:MAG: tRNA lysidine(34) synthetase TilS [Oligoflexus sp.]
MPELFPNILQQISVSVPPGLDSGRQLFIACSGGVDSMVLLHALDELAVAKAWRRPVVLHVNYGLRGEDSEADEGLVKAEAERRGLVCHVHKVSPPWASTHDRSGIQDWARKIRRQWFTSWLDDGDVVALAHHQDDLAENILMRLGRGSGLRLAGMASYKAPYWRPLLPWSKESIRQVASRQKVSFREDESNGKLDYSRNYVRWKVIPEYQRRFPDLVPKLNAFAEDLDDIASYLDAQFAGWIEAPYLVASELGKLNRGLGFYILAAFLKRQIGHYQLSRALLERIWQQIHRAMQETNVRWSEDLMGQFRIELSSGRLTVLAEKRAFGLRAQQHKANILRHMPGVLLEAGARAEVDFACLRQRRYDREDLDPSL